MNKWIFNPFFTSISLLVIIYLCTLQIISIRYPTDLALGEWAGLFNFKANLSIITLISSLIYCEKAYFLKTLDLESVASRMLFDGQIQKYWFLLLSQLWGFVAAEAWFNCAFMAVSNTYLSNLTVVASSSVSALSLFTSFATELLL